MKFETLISGVASRNAKHYAANSVNANFRSKFKSFKINVLGPQTLKVTLKRHVYQRERCVKAV